MADFKIFPYEQSLAPEWDAFVRNSKNATFLHQRNYMDYHADRFRDCSLGVELNGKIQALFPANADGSVCLSHGGLTYGGLLTSPKATVAGTLAVFEALTGYLRKEGFAQLIYKPVPHIYHRLPAEEDLYALFRLGASLTSRSASSAIFGERRIPFRDIRKSGIRKARKAGVVLQESSGYEEFWEILSQNLAERHGVKPVHSLEEIKLLASRFPENIRLHTASLDGQTVAGSVIYLCGRAAHAQYISASPLGKSTGALDLLFHSLINETYASLPVFDFGISTENGGLYLNDQLAYQKEGFGARTTIYDTYTLQL